MLARLLSAVFVLEKGGHGDPLLLLFAMGGHGDPLLLWHGGQLLLLSKTTTNCL